MTLSFLTPTAALVALAGVPAIAAIALAERRSRALCRTLGLRPRGPLSMVAGAAGVAAVAGLLGLAAAQPVLAEVQPVQGRRDAEAIFVLDISRSMLARRDAREQTRFERARDVARVMRRRLSSMPVGIASLTDRVLPHLFPTVLQTPFDPTLSNAVGIERPPPDGLGRGRATALGALADLADHNFFSVASRRRAAVVFTDGESLPFDVADLRDRLVAGRVRVVFVRFWGEEERIFDPRGAPLAEYRPDPASKRDLDELASALNTRVFEESELREAGDRVDELLGEGRLVPAAREVRATPLSEYAVLGAFAPLLLLLWRRNA